MSNRIVIRTEQDALVYLASQGECLLHNLAGERDSLFREYTRVCGRCGGTGRGPWRQDGGICYACHGANTRRTVRQSAVSYARSVRKEELAREKFEQRINERTERQLDGQRDWCEKNGHGRITFAQLDEKRNAERKAEETKRRKSAADAPSGKQTIIGTVVSCVWRENKYGGAWKMVVQLDDGAKVWGTVPSSIIDDLVTDYVDGRVEVHAGKRVTFKATFDRSADDSTFGFFKRPTQAKML